MSSDSLSVRRMQRIRSSFQKLLLAIRNSASKVFYFGKHLTSISREPFGLQTRQIRNLDDLWWLVRNYDLSGSRNQHPLFALWTKHPAITSSFYSFSFPRTVWATDLHHEALSWFTRTLVRYFFRLLFTFHVRIFETIPRGGHSPTNRIASRLIGNSSGLLLHCRFVGC